MTTVVFADLVGSTGIYQKLGDEAASRLVSQLIAVMREVFEQHQGRIVKLLGDGVFVVFRHPGDALVSCIGIQKRLLEKPLTAGDSGARVQVQMGVESGEVVELDGDCFGDTVNSAARLADLAGAGQILTTRNVWSVLVPMQRQSLRDLGRMHLRGRADASHVYRVEWQEGREGESTMMGLSMTPQGSPLVLGLVAGEQVVQMRAGGDKVSIGRGADASLVLTDPRVSRMHAAVEWRGGQFVLSDESSFGTWVYFGNQTEALVLRRTDCFLVGSGQIVAGCERSEDCPLVSFSIGT